MPTTDSTNVSDKPVADKEKQTATQKFQHEVEDDRRTGKPGATNPDATKQDQSRPWTVVVNLATNVHNSTGDLGATAKAKEIRDQVGDYLKNHPEVDKSKVDILMQSLDPQVKKDAHGKDEFTLHRTELRDGQFHDLPDAKSEGSAADLQHILRDAVDRNPNAKLALVNLMHGNATKGFKGDNGIVSLDQMRDTIKKGLADKTADASGQRGRVTALDLHSYGILVRSSATK